MYKTNQPGGNTMFWNTDSSSGAVGTLCFLNDFSPKGTWSLTFTNNTHIKLTAPSGAFTNVVIPTEAAALFNGKLFAYFGVQPNKVINVGQSAVFGRIQITGTTTKLDDQFAGVQADPNSVPVIDPTLWKVVAADPTGVVITPSNAVYWLRWPLSAVDFIPQSSTNLNAGTWIDAGLTNILQVGDYHMVTIPASKLPGNSGFFRLIKPAAGE
jgi:hypothetical protein